MSDIFADPGFRKHLTVYLAVNTMLIVINLITASGTYWFVWPLFGWGIGLICHGVNVRWDSKAQN